MLVQFAEKNSTDQITVPAMFTHIPTKNLSNAPIALMQLTGKGIYKSTLENNIL